MLADLLRFRAALDLPPNQRHRAIQRAIKSKGQKRVTFKLRP